MWVQPCQFSACSVAEEPPGRGGGGGGVVSSPPRSRLHRSKIIRMLLKSLALVSIGLASDRHSRGSKIHARCQLNGKEAEMASRDWICAAAYRRLLISLFEALLHLLSCTFLWRDFGFQRGFLTVINPHSPFLSPVFPRFPFPAASLFPPFCSSDGSLSWFSLFGLFEPLCSGWS